MRFQMKRTLMFLSAALLLAQTGLSQAAVTTEFNWQTAWGGFDFAATATDGATDPVIPSSLHPAKLAIRNAVVTYGTTKTTAALATIKTYKADVNSDAIQDFIIDGSAYVKAYDVATSPLCTTANGCYLTIYAVTSPTNLITTAPLISTTATDETTHLLVTTSTSASCPATAADNTTCLSYCAADATVCPALFQYNMRVLFDNKVLSWKYMTSAEYQSWATGSKASMYQLLNTNPVLAVTMNGPNCYGDEIAANNNTCVKYYQYDPNTNSGTYVDLYVYQSSTGGNYATMYNFDDYATATTGRGQIIGGGFGIQLPAGKSVNLQLNKFTCTGTTACALAATAKSYAPTGFASFKLTNITTETVFIPTNTDAELSAFLNAGISTGVKASGLTYKFTAWTGQTSCPAASVTCPAETGVRTGTVDGVAMYAGDQVGGVSNTIAASRTCVSSTSASMPCQACVATSTDSADASLGCSMTRTCTGPACCVHGTAVSVSSASQCLSRIASHCLAGDAKVALPGGKVKPISEVKAGDTILGFEKTKGKLKPVKVKMVAVTEQEKLIRINGHVDLTPEHAFIDLKGKPVKAASLKAGDKVLSEAGEPMAIEKVEAVQGSGTVYNLQIENGKGFVAEGARVLSMTVKK